MATALGIAMAGCAAPPTLKQQRAARDAKVQYYDDNSFAIRSQNYTAWAFLDNPRDTAIAFLIGESIANVKDISSITTSKAPTYFNKATVNLKNGESFSGEFADAWWMFCKRGVGCTESLSADSPQVSAAHEFRRIGYISHKDLENSENAEPKKIFKSDGLTFSERDKNNLRAVPLSSEETQQFREKLRAIERQWKQQWDAGAPARAAKAKADSDAYKAAEQRRLSTLKSARVGTLLLCTVTNLNKGSIDRESSTACGGLNAKSVGELLSNGWVISAAVHADVGAINATFQKMN